jgi:ribosomal protein S18 acetylase RimI-like enzyme
MDMSVSRSVVSETDLTRIFLELKDKHRNVFMEQIDSQVFFYRSIGRKEYRLVIEDKDLNDFQKENVICDICVLWPQGYDWNECDAGIPEKLVDAIRRNSFLDSIESRQNLLGYYRSEMYDLDNQITCMINEAFPQFDIEEIEEWDVEKTTKYLSRAEWKLHNLRGLQYREPEGDFYAQEQQQPRPPQSRQHEQAPAPEAPPRREPERSEANNTTIRGQNKGKTKLTPDKIREMEEFRKKFPEFGSEWGSQYAVDVAVDDDYRNYGVGSADQESVDKISPALRTPGGPPPVPEIDEEALAKLRAKANRNQ